LIVCILTDEHDRTRPDLRGEGTMTDSIINRVADWLDGAIPADGTPPPEIWGCLEIFGHRKHYGRVREVEHFGTKMLRIDVPSAPAAPLLGEEERFDTHLYGGAAIFSFTPMTEEAARQWGSREGPRTIRPLGRLPPPDDYGDEYEEHEC
jgi:hypothetical protein